MSNLELAIYKVKTVMADLIETLVEVAENEDQEPDKFLKVPGSYGYDYILNLSKKTCTCPHFQYRLAGTDKLCKHLQEVLDND